MISYNIVNEDDLRVACERLSSAHEQMKRKSNGHSWAQFRAQSHLGSKDKVMVEDRKALIINGLRERRFNPLPCFQMHYQCILVGLNIIALSPSYHPETKLPIQPDRIQVAFAHLQEKIGCISAFEKVNCVV